MGKNRLEIDRAAEKNFDAGQHSSGQPFYGLQMACPKLHTGAHQRNLAFEMPGNRNGATDRGGSKHCDDYSRALGWRGCF